MKPSPIKVLGVILVLIPLLGLPVLASALTPAEELAYSLGWDKGVVIVRWQSQYGTGFWIARDYLATAAHVTRSNYGTVEVYKGDWHATCQVVALIPETQGDVEIIHCPSMPSDAHIFPLKPITNKTLAMLKGKPVYVLGFPYEMVQFYGYDLAKASTNPRVAEGTFAWYDPKVELIEFAVMTDAGNSGGPIIDENGSVVGIVSYARRGEAAWMYFATSSNKIIWLARMAGVPIELRFSDPGQWPWSVNDVDAESHSNKTVAAAAAAGLGLALLLAVFSRGGRK